MKIAAPKGPAESSPGREPGVGSSQRLCPERAHDEVLGHALFDHLRGCSLGPVAELLLLRRGHSPGPRNKNSQGSQKHEHSMFGNHSPMLHRGRTDAKRIFKNGDVALFGPKWSNFLLYILPFQRRHAYPP